jgi:hypothetical protein
VFPSGDGDACGYDDGQQSRCEVPEAQPAVVALLAGGDVVPGVVVRGIVVLLQRLAHELLEVGALWYVIFHDVFFENCSGERGF